MIGNNYELTPEDKAILAEIKDRLEPHRDEIAGKWNHLLEETGLLEGLSLPAEKVFDLTTQWAAEAYFSSLEEELRESEETMRALLNATTDFVSLTELDGTIIAINETGARRLGKSVDELIGTRIFDYFPPEVTGSRKALTDELIRSRKPIRFEDERRGMILENCVYPVFSDEGKIERVATFSRDITERKRMEEALRESQQMLQLIVDNIPQFAFWKDRNLVYLGCNKKLAQVVGIEKPEDIVGKTDYDMPWEKEQADSYREYDRRVIDTDTPEYNIIEPILQADGKRGWVEMNKVPLHDSEGRVIGILGTYEDITERKLAEEERERLQQETIEAQAAAIRELATPIVPIHEGIIIMPLVGSIDTRRASQIMEMLLSGISEHQASIVLIDITGVPVMDTGVANHLLEVAKAARLLGSEVIMVGIRPEVAQTIVHLGVDLTGIMTKQNLQRGLEYAFRVMELQIGRREEMGAKVPIPEEEKG